MAPLYIKTIPNNRITLLIVYVNVVLYSVCYQLQRPLEPFLIQSLSVEGSNHNKAYANFQSFFSFIQMIGALLAGYFLDKCGYKIGFMIVFAASALSYYMLSISTSLDILYLSKLPSMLQHGYLCAQNALTIISSEDDRVLALGRLSFCYTIGMIIGPAVGGLIGSTGDYFYGAKIAAFGSLVSFILCFFMTNAPEVITSTTASFGNDADTNKTAIVLSDKSLLAKIHSILSNVWLLLSIKILTGVANTVVASCFLIILKDTFMFDEKWIGYSMSISSGFNAVCNGLLLGPLLSYMGSELSIVIVTCLQFMTVLSIAQGLVAIPTMMDNFATVSLCLYLLASYVLTVFQYLMATSITAESTSKVDQNEKGTLLGMEHSLFAAARIVTPQIGVSILHAYGASGVSLTSGLVFAFIYLYWQVFSSSSSGNKTKIKSINSDNSDGSSIYFDERKER